MIEREEWEARIRSVVAETTVDRWLTILRMEEEAAYAFGMTTPTPNHLWLTMARRRVYEAIARGETPDTYVPGKGTVVGISPRTGGPEYSWL